MFDKQIARWYNREEICFNVKINRFWLFYGDIGAKGNLDSPIDGRKRGLVRWAILSDFERLTWKGFGRMDENNGEIGLLDRRKGASGVARRGVEG